MYSSVCGREGCDLIEGVSAGKSQSLLERGGGIKEEKVTLFWEEELNGSRSGGLVGEKRKVGFSKGEGKGMLEESRTE